MKSTYEIEFTQVAEADLDEIAIYIAENDDTDKAVRVYLNLKEKILNLAEFPGSVPPSI